MQKAKYKLLQARSERDCARDDAASLKSKINGLLIALALRRKELEKLMDVTIPEAQIAVKKARIDYEEKTRRYIYADRPKEPELANESDEEAPMKALNRKEWRESSPVPFEYYLGGGQPDR